MDLQEQILDYNQELAVEVDEKYVKINLASAGKRFGNYLIDLVVFYILVFIVMAIYGVILAATGTVGEDSFDTALVYLMIYGTHVAYHWIMESSFQKTLGKMITKTKVVTFDGRKPDTMNVLGRSLCRFIPFNAFSFLGANAVGWHDSISKTNVINDAPNLSSQYYKIVDKGF